MFFEIAHDLKPTWSCTWKLGPLTVGTDAGWQSQTINDCVFLWKGYSESGELQHLLWEIYQTKRPDILGNFCVIVWDTKLHMGFVKSDVYRSFPIYLADKHSIGNLIPQSHVAWSDSVVSFDPDLAVTEEKFDVIGDVSNQARDIDWIHQRLRTRIQQVLVQPLPKIKIFLSGGVDTLLFYSYLVELSADFEIVNGLHFEFDTFWADNHHLVLENWGYHQLHHWTRPAVLASGCPGDEFMMRTPAVGNLYLLRHNTNILQELDRYPQSMHRDHFLKPKNVKLYQRHEILTDWELCNITVNDWQHWHLGYTMTWTPFRDLEIFKAILHLDYQTVHDQILNSDISRVLIDRNVPGLSECLSLQKNSGNVLANLKPILFGAK